jgi:hypothetical protein
VIRNIESRVYGLTLVGSGISELAANQLSENSSMLLAYAGVGFLLSGLLIFVLGLSWKRDPPKKPLGVLLLSAGLAVVGVLATLLGGWFYTPLFLLALACFVLAYGLMTSRNWALYGMFTFVATGFGVSMIGIGNNGVVNVAGVLSSCYFFWYLGRKHVAQYFGVEPTLPTLSRKGLTGLLILILLFLALIGYFHVYPYSGVTEAGETTGSGVQASAFNFQKDDWVNYSFQSHPGYSPLKVSIRSGVEWMSGVLIASTNGSSGSLTGTIPFTGKYTVYYDAGNGYYGFDYKVTIVYYSWRAITPQWALLDAYGALAVLTAILKTKPTELVAQKPNRSKETENSTDQ